MRTREEKTMKAKQSNLMDQDISARSVEKLKLLTPNFNFATAPAMNVGLMVLHSAIIISKNIKRQTRAKVDVREKPARFHVKRAFKIFFLFPGKSPFTVQTA